MKRRTPRAALLSLAFVAAVGHAAGVVAAAAGSTAAGIDFSSAHGNAAALRSPQNRTSAATVAIRDVKRTRLADVVRVTIELESEVRYRTERLGNPDRVLFDFSGTRPGESLVEGTLSYHDDAVRHVRIGRHPHDVTRVVLDLDGVETYSVFTLYDPYRVVVDCVRKTMPLLPPPQPAQRVSEEPLAPIPIDPGASQVLVSKKLHGGLAALPGTMRPAAGWARIADLWAEASAPATSDRQAHASNETTTGAAAEKAPKAEPAPVAPTPLKDGFSLARQLGLGATRVVIDPGHGGRDPGAPGRGAFESAIVLDVALRLEKLLRAAGTDVVLTRRTDAYIPLEERTAIANRAQGDLFLSIHANASRNPRAQGVESYVLNFASNPEAEAVAARENASSERTMSNLPQLVQAITLNSKLEESRGFAVGIQQALVKRLRTTYKALRDNGVKQAPFVVLIGAVMPSVLVEVSFITNQQEGRLLKTTAYRQKIAEALMEGIRGYQKSLKRAQSISPQ